MEMSVALRNVDTGVVKDGLLVRVVLLSLLGEENVSDLLHTDVRCDSCYKLQLLYSPLREVRVPTPQHGSTVLIC